MPPAGVKARRSPDRGELRPALRDAAEAGVRYYGTLGRLALELVEALVPAAVDLRPGRGKADSAPPAPPALEPASTIVVEAEAGKRGLGVFMVENTSSETVSGPLSVSAFAGPGRKKATPTVTFSPDVVSLDPGDQVLVQVAAAVDETFEPDVRYAAEISVPTLSGGTIPLVVRRRGSTATPRKKPASAASAPSAERARTAARRR